MTVIARLRLLLIVVAAVVYATPGGAQTAGRYAGRPLADVLRDLQSLGLSVVFSSELVRPEMRVASEPKSTVPRKILDEVLEPHGLRAAAGPKGTWLVVRARRTAAVRPASSTVRTGTIHGAIVDKRTGAPLPGVTVTIQDSPLTTVTGPNGEFRLDQVPAEPQQLFVSLVGYGLARPLVNVEPDGTSEVTIALADGVGSYVEEVTVVADRFRAGDPASPSRQTLTSAELRDLGSVLSDDPYRAIQALPGVAAGDDFRSEFSVRGSDFRHIGQSVDGVPMGWLLHATRGTEDTNGTVSILNGDVIDQAALSSGPYPQRQPAALGAWLSLDLREGSRTSTQGHLAVSGTASSLSVDGPLGDAHRGSWLVSVRQSYLQWLLGIVADDDDAVFGFTDMEGKFVFDVTPRQQLQASMLVGRSKLEQTNSDAGPNQAGSAVDRSGLANLAWRSTFSKTVLTQRVAVVGADFVNQGRFDQELGDGHSTTGWYLADVSSDLGHGLTFKGGGSLARQRAALVQRYSSPGRPPARSCCEPRTRSISRRGSRTRTPGCHGNPRRAGRSTSARPSVIRAVSSGRRCRRGRSHRGRSGTGSPCAAGSAVPGSFPISSRSPTSAERASGRSAPSAWTPASSSGSRRPSAGRRRSTGARSTTCFGPTGLKRGSWTAA